MMSSNDDASNSSDDGHEDECKPDGSKHMRMLSRNREYAETGPRYADGCPYEEGSTVSFSHGSESVAVA